MNVPRSTPTGTRGAYLTAREAATGLGVSLPTLYAYVSRGMVHSEPTPGRPRVRRYRAEDITRLRERKELRRDPGKAASRGLHWGSPVLESGLTLIDGGRLFYRGIDAIELARRAALEDVAALLWTGDSSPSSELFPLESLLARPAVRDAGAVMRDLGPIDRCEVALPLAAALDPAAYDLRPAAVARTGARILSVLTNAVSGTWPNESVHVALARTWLPRNRSATLALRAALVLCADHELNVSAFTARCIASSRATPYDVVLGALAALRGRRHGGASELVADLFRETAGARSPRAGLARHLRVAGQLPGFGHPAYPDGDPRAGLLLTLAAEYGRRAPVRDAQRLQRAVHALTGELPNLDFGLATLARALGLPEHAPLAIFALGRTVGWIAHAIEQYADPELIRPRARYTGPKPSVSE